MVYRQALDVAVLPKYVTQNCCVVIQVSETGLVRVAAWVVFGH